MQEKTIKRLATVEAVQGSVTKTGDESDLQVLSVGQGCNCPGVECDLGLPENAPPALPRSLFNTLPCRTINAAGKLCNKLFGHGSKAAKVPCVCFKLIANWQATRT